MTKRYETPWTRTENIVAVVDDDRKATLYIGDNKIGEGYVNGFEELMFDGCGDWLDDSLCDESGGLTRMGEAIFTSIESAIHRDIVANMKD